MAGQGGPRPRPCTSPGQVLGAFCLQVRRGSLSVNLSNTFVLSNISPYNGSSIGLGRVCET